jgi:hypothetical protein
MNVLDVYDTNKRSEVMRAVKSKNTKPGFPGKRVSYSIAKYLASAWCAMMAEVDGPGSSCDSLQRITPIRSGAKSFVW